MTGLLLAFALAPALAASPPPEPRVARCVVKSRASFEYRAPCRFTPEGKGSFTLSPLNRRFMQEEVSAISVWIVGPGRAEVRGLTSEGINSRWGEARRSRRDPACWIGSDFTICAY